MITHDIQIFIHTIILQFSCVIKYVCEIRNWSILIPVSLCRCFIIIGHNINFLCSDWLVPNAKLSSYWLAAHISNWDQDKMCPSHVHGHFVNLKGLPHADFLLYLLQSIWKILYENYLSVLTNMLFYFRTNLVSSKETSL